MRRYNGPRQTQMLITIGSRVVLTGTCTPAFNEALKAKTRSWSFDHESKAWSVSLGERDTAERLACEHYDRVVISEGGALKQIKPYPW